jgi:hypothetical protein
MGFGVFPGTCDTRLEDGLAMQSVWLGVVSLTTTEEPVSGRGGIE